MTLNRSAAITISIDHYRYVLNSVENRVIGLLNRQIQDKQSPQQGGIAHALYAYVNPIETIGSLKTLVPLYFNRDSQFHRNDKILKAAYRILTFLEKVQRPDGTFDGITTNFFSAPDTAFCMHVFADVYRITKQHEKSTRLAEGLLPLIRKAAGGIMEGGFHTPNHRWVVASALMQAFSIVGDSRFRDMAERYLAEGIDCNEDGEYTERSAGEYNIVSNNALIILSDELKRPDLLEYVKRNLDMMISYIEPDGSLFTANSRRQDRDQKCYANIYYPQYLDMAYRTGKSLYAAVANYAMRIMQENNRLSPNCLTLFMENPRLAPFIADNGTKIQEFPEARNYEKHYEDSGIVRIRRGQRTVSMLTNNSEFLFFRHRGIACSLKICASFFAVAQVKPQQITRSAGGGYILTFEAEGSYWMPFSVPPEDPDWRRMDHGGRETVKKLKLRFTIHVSEIENGISVTIESEGCDRVPFKCELCLEPDCMVTGEGFTVSGHAGENIVLKSGSIVVQKEEDCLSIGPGFGLHNYTQDMRGSEEPKRGAFTVHFTDYTPVRRTIQIVGCSRGGSY